MERRRFLLASGAAGLATGVSGCGRLEHLGIPITVHQPGLVEGHRLRDSGPLPTPTRELRTGVAILGSGVAGLTAAWRLARDGHDDFLLLDGPEPDGNAASGWFDSPSGTLPHPRGAHYLPLPSMESRGVREILADLGVIEDAAFSERPRFSETALVHAPDERLYFAGAWHEGLLPTEQVSAEEAGQHRRFLAEVAALTRRRGRDGRRLFCVPKALSSTDAEWRQLDALPFRDWLVSRGYSAPSLHTWLDYVCRDEYGARPEQVSAWAGLHYFAGRGGQAANAADGTVSIDASVVARMNGGVSRTWTLSSAGMVTRCFSSTNAFARLVRSVAVVRSSDAGGRFIVIFAASSSYAFLFSARFSSPRRSNSSSGTVLSTRPWKGRRTLAAAPTARPTPSTETTCTWASDWAAARSSI